MITLTAGFAVSWLEFTGIVAVLALFLQIAYPALIAYTVFNIISQLRIRNVQTEFAVQKTLPLSCVSQTRSPKLSNCWAILFTY